MNVPTTLHTSDLIPVIEATQLVPYSRDHITRLAREGKIVAAQVARRWLVSKVSLQRFYESCRHEDAVRQQYLREVRRRDLEIAEQLRLEQTQIAARLETSKPTFWYSTTVLLSGLLCGVLLQFAPVVWSPELVQSVPSNVSEAGSANVLSTQMARDTTILAVSSSGDTNDRVATSRSYALSLENGLVLLPMVASTSLRSEDFFSDEVEIDMIDTTRGVVRLSDSPDATPLTLLRLPTSNGEIAVTTWAP